jgi:hypothetical protein
MRTVIDSDPALRGHMIKSFTKRTKDWGEELRPRVQCLVKKWKTEVKKLKEGV